MDRVSGTDNPGGWGLEAESVDGDLRKVRELNEMLSFGSSEKYGKEKSQPDKHKCEQRPG